MQAELLSNLYSKSKALSCILFPIRDKPVSKYQGFTCILMDIFQEVVLLGFMESWRSEKKKKKARTLETGNH